MVLRAARYAATGLLGFALVLATCRHVTPGKWPGGVVSACWCVGPHGDSSAMVLEFASGLSA